MWCWRTTSHFRQLRHLSMRDPDCDMALYPVSEFRPRLQPLIVLKSLDFQLLPTRNILSEDVASRPHFQLHIRNIPSKVVASQPRFQPHPQSPLLGGPGPRPRRGEFRRSSTGSSTAMSVTGITPTTAI
jgi:hypothetical protein